MSTANPRRRPARSSSPSPMTLIDSFQNMSIRKGDTFHPNASEGSTEFWDPLASRSGTQPPPRSTTCPKSLEDLLLGAGERRTAELLRKVDQAVKVQSKEALSNVLAEQEVLPVPTFAVHDTDATPRKTRTHSHGSDSGIGSSIASLDAKATDPTDSESLARISAATQQKGLSKYACEQIHKHIVKPILREQALKEFHPLIQEVPSRIGNKDIKNLRDLEKTLIFLAPEYSRSPLKYLEFCERTIRVLHTTVTTLHESDQKAPADRPYTQGYFFDLVEQIRRYATILAATREKQAKGESTDEMDHTDKVSLVGGVSQNGKLAELVRHTKDGKVISLADDRVLSSDEVASASTKRPMADSFVDDEEALRSMARRKKNAKPEIHPCDLCDKEFKRPCDLTKHLKTHERPWKCHEPTCKYHTLGWPTEKECQRHINDKHSNAPALYHCLFEPCPYTSKRESNCKQHMEKAHGWNYIRSKNNGKGKLVPTRLPPGAGGNVPPSPASSAVLTPIAPSPSVQSWSVSGSSRRESMGPPPLAGPSNWGTPALSNPSPDFSDHFNMNNFDFDFNNTSAFPITPAMSEEDQRRPSASSGSLSSGFQLDGAAFDEGISPEDLTFTDRFGMNDFTFPQQVTPDSVYSTGPSSSSGMSHTSPGAQLEQTFTSDAMHLDGFNYGSFDPPTGDFTLYGGTSAAATSAEMFPPLTSESASSWGNFNINYAPNQQPSLNTGHSTLDELFPELKNH